MLVCEHPEDESIFGKRVWNFAKTQKGTVIEFDPTDREASISIQWDDDTASSRCFMMALEIELVEE